MNLSDVRAQRARIRDVIASGKTTTAVPQRKVAVLLPYWTVAFDDDGHPHFRRDIYDRDPPVVKRLKEKFSIGKRRAA